MLLYYITDRKQFPGTDADQRRAVLERIGDAARCGVDYIQLREKDLSTHALEQLAREAVQIVRATSSSTRLLINSRLDVALAVGADGVHLTSAEMNAADARALAAIARSESRAANSGRDVVISVACHSVEEVRLAESCGADLAILAPIFEKPGTDARPLGLEALRRATHTDNFRDARIECGDRKGRLSVIALGGVNENNASECLRAGAAGIAGIRLFQSFPLFQVIQRLRKE